MIADHIDFMGDLFPVGLSFAKDNRLKNFNERIFLFGITVSISVDLDCCKEVKKKDEINSGEFFHSFS